MTPRSPSIPARLTLLLLATLLLAACGQSPSPTLLPSASPSPTPSASPSPTPSPVPTPSPTPSPSPTPTPIPLNSELLGSRFTVLVIGEDSDRSREAAGLTATNTDSIMVVSLSADQSQIVMLSLPRDAVDIPLADGRIYRGKVNGIAYNLGLPALRDAMSTLLGVPIDAYLKVDMDNFVRLVNTVGGVDVVVQSPVYNAKLHLALEPGPAHLNGSQALYFTRSRLDGDYARALRQQQVLLALVRRYVDPTTDWDLRSLLFHLDSLRTDLDLSDLRTLIVMARRAADAEVVRAVLGAPRFALFEGFEPGTTRGWVMIPNVPEMRAYARSLIGD
jgi:LCP family protein required for cell wall assembly